MDKNIDTYNWLNKTINEKEEKFVVDDLNEGINIDRDNKIVSFDSSHQENVDTNDYIYPYIIKNDVRGETVLSIFERKTNEVGNDGNPVIYALKQMYNWRFNNPHQDIMNLLRRFVSVTKHLQMHFDTLLITPSNNTLNRVIFGYLIRLINFENSYSNFFLKLPVREVEEKYVDDNKLIQLSKENGIPPERVRRDMHNAFDRMYIENNGTFSYKYMKMLFHRDIIEQSLKLNFDKDEDMKYRNVINNKDVLVFDDTVASGKTLSDSANAIREQFDPKSITFLTLFSPLNSDYQNKKTNL